MSLLCLLGGHQWGFWHMFRYTDSTVIRVSRVCQHCGKEQRQ